MPAQGGTVQAQVLAATREDPELHQHAGAATEVGGDGRTFDAQCRNRPQTEDEDGVEHDVEGVGDPQHAHCRRRVARAAEDGVDDEQQHDHRIAAEHPLRVTVAVFDDPVVGPHQAQQILCPDDAGEREGQRDQQRQHDGLYRRKRGLLAPSFADTAGNDGGDGHRQAHGNRVEQEEVGLGQPDGGDRRSAQLRNEENDDDRKGRFEHQLHQHRHRQQEDRAFQRNARVVGIGAAQSGA